MTPQQIEDRLKSKIANSTVKAIDTTGTLNHFQIRISAPIFKEMMLIKQHRLVMSLFQPELESGEIHALELKIGNF
jgi:stress-induced morphogen